MLRKALLVCGMLASLLWIGADLLAGTQWVGYSFVDQAVSELSAVDAPTRPLLVTLLTIYHVLLIAFGLGVLGLAGHKRTLRVIAGLFIVSGVLGFIGYFFPLQLGVEGATLTNTIHSIMAGVNGLLFLAAMGFGAFTQGKRFRLLSIGMLLGLIAVGAVMGFMAGTDIIQQGFTTPPRWFGLMERIDIYISMVWMAVLAITLLSAEKGQV